jgi:signal transduction histidine kinase
MKYWFRGKRGGFFAFVLIASLVSGGLGGVTMAALRLEREQWENRAQAELNDKLRIALWRLDSFVRPWLAKEDGRPYNHYSALYAPAHVLRLDNDSWQVGTVLEPSPLLSAELPEWMLLHFQADEQGGWRSPQVLSEGLTRRLQNAKDPDLLANATQERKRLLLDLTRSLEVKTLASYIQEQSTRPSFQDITLELANTFAQGTNSLANPAAQNASPGGYMTQKEPQAQAVDPEYLNRSRQVLQGQARKGGKAQNDDINAADIESELGKNATSASRSNPVPSEPISVALGPMVPLWLPLNGTANSRSQTPVWERELLFARCVTIGQKEVCQGVVLDWPRLQQLLAQEVGDLFPEAQIQPVREDLPLHSERTMSALPFQLDPGPLPALMPAAVWTPLRVGLVLAWVAALVALSAVGLGGWSLIDLSQRRIRFVSAVTHELRTPLTTLRLYLDMLAGGMVRDEKQKSEYLLTLNAEADRLNRLVGNVLDFSRLENQRPRLVKAKVALNDLLEQVRSPWQGRCQSAAKELVVENKAGDHVTLFTDCQLVQQILGNLIDNACKYSRDAEDRRIWLRVHMEDRRVVLEVEDKGPGVPKRERHTIFRPFRRGKGIDATAGGVGLGLALAQRWASLLGGRLVLQSSRDGVGASFRLDLPVVSC